MSANPSTIIDHTRRTINQVLALTWLPYLVALTAAVLYLMQSWGYVHSLDSVLDEGAYLYKGYAFVSGQYRIYQDDGFWSNHMPLSFYIPGAVQALFAPGLRAGRYFAVFLGGLMLLGSWIVTRRLGGAWWAALVLAGLAINPAIIKMYSPALTQVLISCMLVWVLVLTLGDNRPPWQLMLGAMLAAAMWMTRINMSPLLPLLLVYIFWQYGRKIGLAAMLAGGLTLLLLHIPFWPDILRFYAYWLPESLTSFLGPWQPPRATPYWNPKVALEDRFNSFFRAYRYHFLAISGVVVSWIVWPRKSGWKSLSQYRSAVFLSVLFLSLYALHFWATMSKSYCAYCLEGYTAFFASLGWMLLALTFASWSRALAWWRQAIAAGFVLIIATGVGFSAYAEIGRTLLEIDFSVLGLPTIASLLENKYQVPPTEGQYLVATLAGLAGGIVILAAAGLLVFFNRNRPEPPNLSFGYSALLILFLVGVLLTPTPVLGRGYQTFDCGGDVISSYESVGAHLARLIPLGSKVYWKGGLSFAPLLYVPGIQIYPSQVNGDYSFYLDGDSEALEKYGFWNPDLANRWLNEADFALIEQRYYPKWFRDTVDQDRFMELEPTPDKVICRDNSQIRIFKRIR
jgi:hypothetical protein